MYIAHVQSLFFFKAYKKIYFKKAFSYTYKNDK